MLISHNPIIGYQVAIAMNMHIRLICKSNPGADELWQWTAQHQGLNLSLIRRQCTSIKRYRTLIYGLFILKII